MVLASSWRSSHGSIRCHESPDASPCGSRGRGDHRPCEVGRPGAFGRGAGQGARLVLEGRFRAEGAQVVEKIPAASLDFDRVYARLKAGRVYGKAKTGEFYARSTAGVAGVLENRVDVPAEYDPARKWPLRVQLHGGVNRPRETIGGPDIEGEPGQTGGRGGGAPRSPGVRGRTASPGSRKSTSTRRGSRMRNGGRRRRWRTSPELIDQVSRRYNVDESHIYLTGISDGGTGAYYLAMRDATRWSA